jgi:hypothetical protein
MMRHSNHQLAPIGTIEDGAGYEVIVASAMIS